MARFVSFVAGSAAAVLLFLTLLDERLLERDLFGRQVGRGGVGWGGVGGAAGGVGWRGRSVCVCAHSSLLRCCSAPVLSVRCSYHGGGGPPSADGLSCFSVGLPPAPPHTHTPQVVWWVALVGVVLAVSRALVVERGQDAFDPEMAMLQVVAHTHYLPRHWRGRWGGAGRGLLVGSDPAPRERGAPGFRALGRTITHNLHIIRRSPLPPLPSPPHPPPQPTPPQPPARRGRAHTREVQEAFSALFPYRALLFLEELASVALTPLLLATALPRCAGAVLAFAREHSVGIQGVGDVCSLAAFDFGRHGNGAYGSPQDAPKVRLVGVVL